MLLEQEREVELRMRHACFPTDPDTQPCLLNRHMMISPAWQQTVSCWFVSLQCPRGSQGLASQPLAPQVLGGRSPPAAGSPCQAPARTAEPLLPPCLRGHSRRPTQQEPERLPGDAFQAEFDPDICCQSGECTQEKKKGKRNGKCVTPSPSAPSPGAGRNGHAQAAPSIIYSSYNRDDILKAICCNYTEIHFLL